MRVATWNVNGLKARFDLLKHWLAARTPDVVGLQEIKTPDPQFPHTAFEALGYQTICHGQKSWNGVAVLSRLPVSVLERGLPGQEEMGARLLAVEVAGLNFVTVYCPNGKSVAHPDFARKLAWIDALTAWTQRALATPAGGILCGDFNICPGPLDSWNEDGFTGQIFHTDDERARLGRLVDGRLSDVFRERHPTAREFTWWDYRAGAFHRKHGLRIDLLLATPAVARRVRTVEIDREYRKKLDGLTASDHAPVFADLD